MYEGSKEFWEVIGKINWEGICAMPDNLDRAKTRMLNATYKSSITVEEFESAFQDMKGLVNQETLKRVEANVQVFADYVSYGGDDCHFMDLPAHLVGLGEEKVIQYIQGGLIDFTPVECLSYIFH